MIRVDRYLECWRLRKVFPTKKGRMVAVSDFSLLIERGEFVSLIGHSGCGKSTVLSMIAGLYELDGGGLVLDGREVSGASPDRAVVFQSPNLLPWLTALQNVTLGIEQRWSHLSKHAVNTMGIEWLERVGLGRALDKKPVELSQGMQQRVGIARAFALRPKVLLLDEPFGMLDSLTRVELQDLLLEVWQTDRVTTVMVTHDVDEAVRLSDRIVMMTNGPEATIGEICEVDLPRPRTGPGVLESELFTLCRERVLHFLDQQETVSKVCV